MFFLTIGRPVLKLASLCSGTEVMGFFHMFADADADLGCFGDLVKRRAGPIERE